MVQAMPIFEAFSWRCEMSNISHAAPVLALLISLPATANDTKASLPTAREMAHCMMVRVKTTPNETYKSAFKACRDQFESAVNDAPSPINAMNNVDTADNPKP
jgi:hypothetical protein